MKKKYLVIGIILLVLIIIATLLFMKQSQPTNPPQMTSAKPIYPSRKPASVPQTTLSFSQSPAILKENGTFQTEVFINTGENRVTAITLSIGYDPTLFSVSNVEPVDILAGNKILTNQIDNTTGKLLIVSTIDPEKSLPIVGTDALIKITFTPQKLDTSQIALTFLPETNITAQEITTNALTEAKNTTITIQKQANQ